MAKANERWDFRVAAETDKLVRDAAGSSDRTLTEFVVAAASVEAARVLADRSRFALSEADWDRFVALLERPPRENPGLAQLFAKPSVFADA